MPSVAQEHSLLKPKECEKSPFSCLCCLFSLSPIFWTLKPTFSIFISPWRSLHFLTALLCLGLRHQELLKYSTHTPATIFAECSWACDAVFILTFIKSTFWDVCCCVPLIIMLVLTTLYTLFQVAPAVCSGNKLLISTVCYS